MTRVSRKVVPVGARRSPFDATLSRVVRSVVVSTGGSSAAEDSGVQIGSALNAPF